MGRRLEFDKDQALLQAMQRFWAQGYDGTSMRDLAQKLNLHLGSVYNALGDKERVFEAALRLHIDHHVMPRIAALETSADPRRAIEDYIAAVAADCQSDSGAPGCFIINSLLKIDAINDTVSGIIRDYLRLHEKALTHCIETAQAEGHIPGDEKADKLARFILAGCKSIYVMKKIGANDDFIRDIRDTLNRRVFATA